jgi:two-component system, sporulation sensor kinase D
MGITNRHIPVIDIYALMQRWKLLLIVAAVAIGGGSLLYTNMLVNKLSEKEQKKASIWAEATRLLLESAQTETDLNFLFKVIEDNNTVPVILTDQDNKVLYYRNLNNAKASKPGYLAQQLELMRKVHPPLVIELGNGNKNYIYYKESILLQQLAVYPYLQLAVIIIFAIISYIAFSSSRKAEQNKVWLGLSKETAHQLGTPASSLMAWIELLKDKVDDPSIIAELEKDVQRLNVITERFSKIGSPPKLDQANLCAVIDDVVVYMRRRVPASVEIMFIQSNETIELALNVNLFGWVIENLIKNALDAISNKGFIEIKIINNNKQVIVDLTDNGKGILKRNFVKVFKPGFTTKARGWGLGLSLTKRIIEEYHGGRIFVLRSEIGKGTTFRILIPSK